MIVQLGKDNKPPSAFIRMALNFTDIGLEYVAATPSILGIGGSGEKLTGTFAEKMAELIPEDMDSFGAKANFWDCVWLVSPRWCAHSGRLDAYAAQMCRNPAKRPFQHPYFWASFLRKEDLMAKMADILGKLVSDVSIGNEKIPSLLLDESAESDRAISGLMIYFGEEDSREAVEVLVNGEQAGFITRNALHGLVAASGKGIGSLDPAFLPGQPNYILLEPHCPVHGCTESEYIIHYDPGLRRKCPKHPHVFMEPKP